MANKETMTSRDRVLKSLSHEIPDRVPIDLGGFQTGIHRIAYERLINHLGIEDEITIMDPVQQLAKPCEELLQRFHVDIRYITAHGPDGFDGSIKHIQRNGRLWHDLSDEFGVVWSMPDDQKLYMDISHHPLAEATIDDLDDFPFPDGSDPTRFTGVRDTALRMRNETSYAISTGIGGVIYEYCWYMRGLEQWFIDMIENPGFCEALLDKTLKFWMDYHSGFMEAVGDIVDVVMIGDDLAGQTGPLFSPDFYRKVVKPRQKRLVSHIKTLTNAKIWYHTCGSCTEFIPDLIDNGIDILNPIQISAKNMSPRTLKQKFGDVLAFWGGGIDPQHVLPFATPNQIREHVQKNIEIFMTGGGYVFNNVHNIQAEVPSENVISLFEAAYDYGFYK
jgi:uroporphyrinogen decarboxylase